MASWYSRTARPSLTVCHLHLKTFAFDAKGEEATIDLKPAFDLLKAARYAGAWGVESVPRDGDEWQGARKTIELIRKWGR